VKPLNKHKQVILKVLKGVKTHPTADWIYSEVKKEITNVSLGTVYRNLNYLTENKYILKLDYSGVMSRFDGNPMRHPHIICTECGRVDDVDIKPDKSIFEKVAASAHYVVNDYRLEFSGICFHCQKAVH